MSLGFAGMNWKICIRPVLWVNGGSSDIAYENSIANYNLTNTPAYYAENKYAGHSGLLYGIREGNGDTH